MLHICQNILYIQISIFGYDEHTQYVFYQCTNNQGLYSLSGRTSYHKILWSLEVAIRI